MKQAIIYSRFSTPSQEKGDSLNRQLSDCREFCKRHGLEVVEEIADLGVSAYKGDHLSIGNLGKLNQRILDDELRGMTLVFEKFDRLSRQKPRIVQRWIEDACDHGVTIAVLDGEKFIDEKFLDNGSNMMALLDILMNSHASNIFSKNLSDRMSKSWRTRKEEARKTGKAPSIVLSAWLYRDEEGTIQIDEERQALLVRIFEMTAEGMGSWSLAKALNAEGIPSWGHKQKGQTEDQQGWNAAYIRKLIKNPAVEGDHHFTVVKGRYRIKGPDVIHGLFPRAVDADLVARARNSTHKRGSKSGGRWAAYSRNLFSGIAMCSYCGSKMILTGRALASNSPAYLQCDSAKRKKGCKNKTCFNYNLLEPTVLDKVLSIALDDRFFKSDSDEIKQLTEQYAQASKALSDAEQMRQGYSKLLALKPDDRRLQGDYEAASLEMDRMEELATEAANQLASARGSTSPAEHIARVKSVQNEIKADDEEIMKAARRRVHASLQEVITHMVCRTEPVEGRKLPAKFTDIAIADGLITFTVDGNGKVIQEQDFRDSPDHIHGLTTGPVAYNANTVDEILKRS